MCTYSSLISPTEGSALSRIPVNMDFFLHVLALNMGLCVMRMTFLPSLSLLTERTELRF